MRRRQVAAIKGGIAVLFLAAAVGAGATGTPVAPAGSGYWAFRPLRRPTIPLIRKQDSGRLRGARDRFVRQGPSTNPNPVDAFILSALVAKGISPAPAVDRRKLLRRVTFDLTGLPPTPEEVDRFARDTSPDAYERVVDRLLASPEYGERWGRHWLDLARYADSDGQESDEDRPTAYRYRDFVIRALNDDLPYDTFVRWQLAGDEIEPDNPLAVAATGFLTAGTHAVLDSVPMEEEKVRERYNELDDIAGTTGTTFLALTLGCARCHDHKYDPIPTRDYYRLLAAFNAGDREEVPLLPHAEAAAWRSTYREWRKKLAAARLAKDSGAERALEANKPAGPTALGYADFGAKPRESWLLERGDFHRRAEPVELGFVSTLCRDRAPSAYWAAARARGVRSDTTYQRRALAEWMTDPAHGAGALLARVIVNRLWQGHFGEGLVRTVSDFGKRSDPPSHPELLEWLASDLVRGGWRLKRVHRMLVLSAAYRQSGVNCGLRIADCGLREPRGSHPAASPGAKGAAPRLRTVRANPQSSIRNPQSVDPENRLLSRRPLRRMEAEVFRDSMLAVAGTLNPERYGPAFKPPIQREALQARNVQDPYPQDARDTPETRRRSVYMFHKRVVQYPLLQAFDGPDASAHCGRRNVTTVAPQALAVLNEPFIRRRALEFAERLRKEAGSGAPAQVERAYRLALARKPAARELEAAVRFLERQSAAHRAKEPNEDAALLALADFGQVLFGLNEFIYVD